MGHKQGIALILSASCLLSCANRIKKVPVDQQVEVQAQRAAMEGDGLLREGKDHLALLKYIEASTLNPYSEVIFNKVAIGYSRLLQFEQARRAIDRAVRLNPNYAYGHNTRGIIQLATRDLGGAIESFRRAIQFMPRKAAFHVNLGNAYLQRGRFDEGRESFLRALALDPKAFDYEGVIQVASLRGQPDSETSYKMARLFAEIGDRAMALHHLRKALIGGFKDGKRLRSDPAFRTLLEDPEFKELVDGFGL